MFHLVTGGEDTSLLGGGREKHFFTRRTERECVLCARACVCVCVCVCVCACLSETLISSSGLDRSE